MKPIDYRNETWDSLQERLAGLRLAAWQGWLAHGPGTTREVAQRCGMDILTFRPRTTELYQMGFLRVVESDHGHAVDNGKGEGVYAAHTLATVRATFERARLAAVQPELALT